MIRRFKKIAKKEMVAGVHLPKAIAIDEYKGDTDAGKYQLIIANAETKNRLIFYQTVEKKRLKTI